MLREERFELTAEASNGIIGMSNLSGLLSEDALGLWLAVGKLYTSQELTKLSEWYRVSWEEFGCHEPMIARTPGAGFNPRPARLARLLMDSDVPPSVNLIGSALLLPSRVEIPRLPIELRSTIETIRAFRSSGQPLDLSNPGALSGSALLAFSSVLDDLRHTHMIDDDRIRAEWWESVAPLAESLMTCKDLMPKHRQQLATALSLQERRVHSKKGSRI
jgi:hypothetical protein